MEKLVDTNIIVRVLVNDNKTLALQAKKTLENNKHIVTPVILAETMYVLNSFYQLSRKELHVVKDFLSTKYFVLEREEIAVFALEIFYNSNLGFQDCWLVAQSIIEKKEITTQDKQLQKVVLRFKSPND